MPLSFSSWSAELCLQCRVSAGIHYASHHERSEVMVVLDRRVDGRDGHGVIKDHSQCGTDRY